MATQALEPRPAQFIGVIPSIRRISSAMQRFVLRWIIGYRSPAEKIEAQQKRLEAMRSQKEWDERQAEAEGYANKIRSTYTRYNIVYRYKKSEQDQLERLQEVEFVRPYIIDKEVVRLKVNTRNLPRGIGLQHLEDEYIKRLLSINCGHRVTTYANDNTGYWLMIERDEGVGGIPRHIFFEKMILERPAHLAGERLAFPVGVGESKKPIWRTVPQSGNLLIAGSPDAGKSNMANAIICCLLKHNSPSQLKLLLVDLKGGLEFSFYAGLTDYLLKIPKPKAKAKPDPEEEIILPEASCDDLEAAATEPISDAQEDEIEMEEIADDIEEEEEDDSPERVPAFIDRRENVPAALSYLIRETERRQKVLGEAGVKKIQTYNQNHPYHMMPYIVAFIDEWADVKLDRALGAKCEDRLINITNRARATGIYVYLATQSPTKEVLTRRVMNAMNSRIVFRCADQYMSMTLMQSYEAAQIQTGLKGRGYFISGSDKIQLQTPYIPDEVVERFVADANGGKIEAIQDTPRHDVQDREVYEWALTDNEGNLGWREIYEKFKERGFSQPDAQKFIKGKAGKMVEVDGKQYTVFASSGIGKNKKPARMLPIT